MQAVLVVGQEHLVLILLDRHVVAVDKALQELLHVVRVHVVEEKEYVVEAQLRRLAPCGCGCGSCLDDGTEECFDFIRV